MNRGYIKIWRKISDSGLFQLHSSLAMFVYMLTEATHKPTRFGTVDLQRGQLVTGRHKLAEHLGLSEQKVRTCLEHLHKLNMITSNSTNKYTIYTIVNYSKYQDALEVSNQQDNQQVTNNQPTSNQQVTTIQEHKHISTKEDKYIPPINGALLADWLQVRKAKRSGLLTETAFKGLQREARKAGLTDEQAVQVCCERSWQSFKAEWYIPKPNSVQEARLDTARQIQGGLYGNSRQIKELNPRPAIEGCGEVVSEIALRLRESDAG